MIDLLPRPVAAALLAALATVAPRPSFALDAKACVASANAGATARTEGKLRAAREQLALCSDAACPDVVRTECVRLSETVLDETPTVMLTATSDGVDVADVTVSIDGAPFAGGLDGQPHAADPGKHVFRFARAGSDPVERVVLLNVGDKRRLVAASWVTTPAATRDPTVAAAQDDGPPPAVPSREPPRLLPWLLGGAGVATAGAGLWLQLSTASRARELRGDCAPYCDPDEVSRLRRQYWGAAGLYVLSAAALGGGVWLLASPRGGGGSATGHGHALLTAIAAPGGAVVDLRVSF